MKTPSQLRSDTRESDEAAVAAAERTVDAALIRDFENRDEIFVSIDSWQPRVVSEVVRRYSEGGWAVRVVHDQREGSSIALSERRR